MCSERGGVVEQVLVGHLVILLLYSLECLCRRNLHVFFVNFTVARNKSQNAVLGGVCHFSRFLMWFTQLSPTAYFEMTCMRRKTEISG